MTTNFKTAIRTGGGLPAQGPQNQSSFFGGLIEKLKSFTPKQKIIGVSVIVGIIALILLVNVFAKATAYVPVYSELSPSDVTAISAKLSEAKIDYRLDGKTVLVSPAKVNKAKIFLAQYGLPHAPVAMPSGSGAQGNSLMPPTQGQLDEDKKVKLEGDMVMSIREMDGIADAIVKITLPDRSLFAGDQNPPTAAVMLKLQPGFRLAQEQVNAIAFFVSSSAPGLSAENVKIVDIQGRNYLVDTKTLGGKMSALPEIEQEKVIAYENRLKDKIKESLNGVLDPDKYTVALSVDMDFSQAEITEEKYGGPTNVEGQVKTSEDTSEESFSSMPEAKGADQMGGVSEAVKGSKGEYVKKTGKTTYNVDAVKKRIVTAPGTVKRITASVAVDNLQPELAGKIKELVSNSIGADETRGDKVSVISMPFSNYTLDEMKRNMLANPVPRSAVPISNNALLVALALVPMMMLIIVVAYFMIRQKNMIPEVRFNQVPSATQVDIGKTSLNAAASNTAFKLEMLAKEKPTRVAELLKSTWLADKER